MQVNYDIREFDWDANTNALSAEASTLWPMGDYNIPYPNGRKQFYIINTHTKGFRRFRLLVDLKKDLLFISEDNILCLIKNVNNF